MSEVKKVIISRKKIDSKGNEYALMEISSNMQKSKEKRIIKFKKSPKKSKSKRKEKEENSTTTKKAIQENQENPPKNENIPKKPENPKNVKKIKNFPNNRLIKRNVKSKRSDSPTTKSSKFTSFISTFNTPSKGKNSFIYNSPKPYIYYDKNNFKFISSAELNNYLYNPSMIKNNSEFFKTEYTFSNNNMESDYLKARENLSKKIIVLSRKNNECFDKINNLKMKESKLNNIKINKLKDKEEIKKSKKKEKNELKFKKQLLSEIREINKFKKQAIDEIKLKENKLIQNNNKKENNKLKNIIKNTQKINYQKNREYYLKIRKEEAQMKKSRLRYNLSGIKNTQNNNNLSKGAIHVNKKEIDDLMKKYKKLKALNTKYNSFINEIKNMDFRKTFTSTNLNNYSKSHLSYTKIDIPKKMIIYENRIQKDNNKKIEKTKNKNISVFIG